MTQPWSVSAHRLYDGCPRAWWLRNVAHVPTEDSADSVRGVVLHAALAAGYAADYRVQQEGWPSDSAHVDVAVEKAVVKAVGDFPDYDDPDEAIDTCLRALAYLGPQPGDRVIGVEVDMEIAVDGVPIIYRADALYERAGVLVVRDWKSTAELPRSRDLTRNRQLALGALCAGRTYAPKRIDIEIASINAAVAVSAPIDVTAARSAGSVVAATARKAQADTTFEPKPGEVCADCKVRAHCPVFAPDGTSIFTPGPDGQPTPTGVITV
jgi:hypothetical protein